MSIRLDKKVAEGLVTIANLPDDAIAKVRDAVVALGGEITIERDQIKSIIESCTGLKDDELSNAVGAIGGLFFYLTETSEEEREVLDEIISSLSRFDFAAGIHDKLRSNLHALFEMRSLYAAFKAANLSRQSERYLEQSKILTDIRPVFGNSLDSGIFGYLVSYTLKLSYADARGDGEFFVSFDEKNLFTLKRAIDRAVEKVSLLKAKSGLPVDQFLSGE